MDKELKRLIEAKALHAAAASKHLRAVKDRILEMWAECGHYDVTTSSGQWPDIGQSAANRLEQADTNECLRFHALACAACLKMALDLEGQTRDLERLF